MIGRSRSGNTTKIHVLSANEKTPVALSLSVGNSHDAPCDRRLLDDYGKVEDITLIADRAYEGYETRKLAENLGYDLCIPPKSNHNDFWDYDKELYKRRNEI